MREQLESLWAMGDENEVEVLLDLLFQEFGRRVRIVGNGYPFVEDLAGLQRRQSGAVPYDFLLLVSVSAPLRKENRQQEVEKLVDELTLDALRGYLGVRTQGVRFGWPPSGDRPTGFGEAVKWLCGHMGLRPAAGVIRSKSNDGGLDVIAWTPFRDGRMSFVSVLAQCTVADDWFPKAKDLIEDVWRGWVDFGKTPATCLAVPFVIPIGFEKWDELRRTVTVVMDRLRLCECLDGVELSSPAEMEDWLRREREIIAAA